MQVFRRFCALGVSGLIVGGLLSGVALSASSSLPAGADTPEAFAGAASAQALQLKLFGTNLTVGSTNVAADSTPKAHADGAGVALITATVSNADADAAHPSVAPPKACGLKLPLPGLLAVALACSQSAGATTNAAPSAVSGSNIAALEVQALSTILNVLQPILSALIPIADQVLGTVLTTVQSVVQPILGTTLTQLLGGLGIQPTAPVSSLITALQNATELLTVDVGDTASSVVTAAGKVAADADAQGATISLLPALNLLTITVGHAHTTSTFNRATGVSAATFDPAILTVKLLGTTIPVALGAPLTLFAGTALESTISLGAGSTKTNADNSVSAVADGVGIDLLKGINGGISLHLAHAQSVVGGVQAQVGTTTTTTTIASSSTTSTTTSTVPGTTTTTVPLIPITGSNAPLLPIGFALILSGYLTRRVFLSRRAARAPR